jgi:hypothetical protein
VKDYIYMGSKLNMEYQTAVVNKYYYTSNQINSTRMITDSTGTVVYSAVFDPYGGMQKQWGTKSFILPCAGAASLRGKRSSPGAGRWRYV